MSNKFKVTGNLLPNTNTQYHTFSVGDFVFRNNEYQDNGNGFVYTIDPDHSYMPQRILTEHVERVIDPQDIQTSVLTPVAAPSEAPAIVPVANDPAVPITDENTTVTATIVTESPISVNIKPMPTSTK